jgi:adenosylhomocysteine nucleosidase
MPHLTDPTSPGPKVGIVCGLQLEADWLDAAWSTVAGRVEIAVAGMGPVRAAEAATRLLESGVRGLISWGSAAGLDPGLAPGTVVLPKRVLTPSGALEATVSWVESLAGTLGSGLPLGFGDLAEAGSVLADVPAKAGMGRSTGAVAADMESAAVARVASGSRIPWIAVRAIADPADQPLPSAVLDAIGEDGVIDPAAVIRSAATSVSGLRSLLRLRRQHMAAGRSMRRLARLAGPLLASPNLEPVRDTSPEPS